MTLGILKLLLKHEAAIVAAYLSGATASEAVAPFGYSTRACYSVLRRHSIEKRGQFIPKEQELKIVEAYLAGASQEKAAALFGYTGRTCDAILKRNNIVPRNRSQARRLVPRRYNVDEAFFDKIDTEEKAYWLGFLTADGAVYTDAHETIIRIQLKATDVNHLHKFAAALHSEHPVVVAEKNGYKKRLQAHILINSVRLVTALNQLGLNNRKSFTVEPCQQVPPSLLSAYWRGIFDGDGHIGFVTSTCNSFWVMQLCGSKAVVTGFQTYMGQFVNSRAKIRPNASIFSVAYAGTFLPQTIAKILYQDASVYLDRKFEKAQRLLALTFNKN